MYVSFFFDIPQFYKILHMEGCMSTSLLLEESITMWLSRAWCWRSTQQVGALNLHTWTRSFIDQSDSVSLPLWTFPKGSWSISQTGRLATLFYHVACSCRARSDVEITPTQERISMEFWLSYPFWAKNRWDFGCTHRCFTLGIPMVIFQKSCDQRSELISYLGSTHCH